MKILKNIFILFLSFSFILSGCKDYIEAVDEVDPTRPTDAPVDLVVTAMQTGVIGMVEGDIARLSGLLTDQFSGEDRQYVSYDNYTLTSGDFDSPWANIYATVIKSADIVIEKGTAAGNEQTVALGQLFKGYTLGMSAALWGDVPATQANNLEEFPNPIYDDQAAVYQLAIDLLDDAINNLDGTGNLNGDVFGLDAAQYIEVANTIKAKFHLHLGEYPQAITAAENGISDEANDLMLPHGGGYGQDFNIYYSFLVYDRTGYLGASTAFAPDFILNRNNDKTDEGARYNWYYQDDGNYSAPTELNYYSVFDLWGGDGFFGTTTSFPAVTYAENNLILAEANLREGNFANSLAYLNDHRVYLDSGSWQPETASNITLELGGEIQYDEYVAADFDNGGILNPDGLSAEDALYKEIIEEKYVTLLGTLEVFNDMRRSGFGSFSGVQNYEVMGLTPKAGSTFPQRFIYPQDEVNSNENIPSPIPGLFEPTPVNQ